ncbi:hypothetical protein ACFWNT_07705 [Streptomyces sp. NPDC058409]|uniref:hypothetical protein n=1 Tax=Streptomyces sp. NPDC058409 TaxID=3346484 RepID=UPI00364A0718
MFLTDDVLPDEPRAATGCAVCRALKSQWRQATDKGNPAYDMSHAVDLAIEISRHPHAKKRQA